MWTWIILLFEFQGTFYTGECYQIRSRRKLMIVTKKWSMVRFRKMADCFVYYENRWEDFSSKLISKEFSRNLGCVSELSLCFTVGSYRMYCKLWESCKGRVWLCNGGGVFNSRRARATNPDNAQRDTSTHHTLLPNIQTSQRIIKRYVNMDSSANPARYEYYHLL